MSRTGLEIPVALIVFSRPSHTRKVFDAITAVRPKMLFVIADGPRPGNAAETIKCNEVRDVVQNVKWPCDLQTDFAEQNMGCYARTVSGTDWVFRQTNEAIFLEDDTLPDLSFFEFCTYILKRYRSDERVMSVSGFNRFPRRRVHSSYFFSNLANPWGRALWRRSWELFDPNMSAWPEVCERGCLRSFFRKRSHFAYWERIMEATYQKRNDSWAYRFALTCWLQHGLTVVPARNLVKNIGFGADATHTRIDQGQGQVQLQSIEFPLHEPAFMIPDLGYDEQVCDRLARQRSIWMRAKGKATRWMGSCSQ